MKKLGIFTAVVFLGSILFVSCAEDCKDCKIQTFNATDSLESETAFTEYCGADLEEIDGQEETDPVGIKTVYVCE